MTRVERSDHGTVARLTLNAPERLNALSTAMIDDLHGALDGIADDPAINVVILAANGKAFCAGHDIREMQAARQSPDGGAAAFKTLFESCTELMLRIQSLPQPVIAQVQGVAAAAGCQLVATCDMAMAADTVKFGVNGVNIGLFCSTPMVALSRVVPPKAAFEMLTTGRMIDAHEAQTLGLINRACAPDALATETIALAETIAAKLPTAVRLGKQAFYDQAALPTAEAYALTGDVIVQNLLDQDTAEGMSAFLEKRPASFGTKYGGGRPKDGGQRPPNPGHKP